MYVPVYSILYINTHCLSVMIMLEEDMIALKVYPGIPFADYPYKFKVSICAVFFLQTFNFHKSSKNIIQNAGLCLFFFFKFCISNISVHWQRTWALHCIAVTVYDAWSDEWHDIFINSIFFLHETDEINENNVTDLYNKMNRTIDNKY